MRWIRRRGEEGSQGGEEEEAEGGRVRFKFCGKVGKGPACFGMVARVTADPHNPKF